MVDFINEVEEELRKDDYNRLLKKYGPLIGAVLFLIVAGTAFLEWQKSSKERAAQKVAAVYTAADEALEAGSPDEAVTRFAALGETGPNGYAGLALMRAAAIEQEKGNLAQAIAFFDQAAAKFDSARHKQLAQLKAAYLVADQGAYSDVIARLNGLAEEDAPYEFLARELLGYAHEQSGDLSAARQQYSYLTSIPGVPASVKGRAEQSMSLLNARNSINAPEPLAPDVPVDAPVETSDDMTTTDPSDEN